MELPIVGVFAGPYEGPGLRAVQTRVRCCYRNDIKPLNQLGGVGFRLVRPYGPR
jgi:hypothetical protein